MKLFLSQLIVVDTKYSIFWKGFASILEAHSIHPEFLCDTLDIWCRDYLPIQVSKDRFVQFSLSPDYYPPNKQHLITNPAPICRDLGITPKVPTYNGLPIFLDGGNVVLGFNKAIICEKVFKDNDIPKTKLLDILIEALEVDQLIIIPQEPDDYTGHADGMVRWLDSKTVLVNDYTEENSDRSFRVAMFKSLKNAGLSFLRVPYSPAESHAYVQPATGFYINYLQVGEKIFLPTFDDELNDQAAVTKFREIFGSENVLQIPCLAVAAIGGVLNCLSWEIFD